ncbi:MAG: site-specific integrase [Nitrospirota bacterium]|nr:site-specific integrase [Nitrospirota bacterium]
MANTLAPPSLRPRLHPSQWQGFTSFASPQFNAAVYEAECLAGRCFPRPGDTDMLLRCRETYRLTHWLELFQRFHADRLTHQSRLIMKSCFNRYFPPLLELRPSDLTRPVVTQWFHEIGRYSTVQANKSLSLLRTIFTKAEEWQLWDGVNPASRIKWYKRNSRTRFIQPEEMPELLESLALESLPVQCFFLLCLLCGCRGGEARAMKWADLNLTQGLWSKPTTKTGQPHQVPLPPALTAMLCTFPQTEEWVFCSPRHHGGPVKKSTCFHNWRRIRARAGLNDVTIHDLRRSCASWLACSGENIAVVGKVLNHASLVTTQIYARLNLSPVRAALDKHADALLGSGSARITQGEPVLAQVTVPTPLSPPLVLNPVQEREEWPG